MLQHSQRFFRSQKGLHKAFSTLVISEPCQSNTVPLSTLSAINAAKKLNKKIDVFIAGEKAPEAANKLASFKGIDKVYLYSKEGSSHLSPEASSALILQAVEKSTPTHIIGTIGTYTRDVLPRVGAQLSTQPVTDVVQILGEDSFIRPIYAGNALATVEIRDATKVIGVRGTAFSPEALEEGQGEGKKEELSLPEGFVAKSKFLSLNSDASDKPSLASAKVVVAGGRGLKSGDNFKTILEPLCDKLNAALGASRAAVDANMVPNDLQIGQTGKIVAPQLYFAVGISGATQHLAGMKDSKVIVAINKDGEAPIFQVADYGIVGDLFEIIPELTQKIQKQ